MHSSSVDPAVRLAEAYKLHAEELRKLCERELESKEDAEEIVQEAFLRAWRYMKAGRVIMNVKIFLTQTVQKLLLEERRRRSENQEVSLESMRDGPDTIRMDVEQVQKQLEASRLLGHLKKNEQTLVTMRYYEDMSPAAIASKVGLTPNTVAVRLHRTMRTLAKKYLRRQRLPVKTH